MSPGVGEWPPWVLYEEPVAPLRTVVGTPQLASWDAAGSPSQMRLAAFLDEVEEAASEPLGACGDDGLAMRLQVGLRRGSPLIGSGGDLDNCLYPVARRLGARRLVSAWATKHHGPSGVRIQNAVPMEVGALASWLHREATTVRQADSAAWKHEVRDQIEPYDLGDGPVECHVAYRLHPSRNWSNLWKPTFDALGPVLGEGPRVFHPRDGRITRLAFHRVDDSSLGWSIRLGVWLRREAS